MVFKASNGEWLTTHIVDSETESWISRSVSACPFKWLLLAIDANCQLHDGNTTLAIYGSCIFKLT